MRLSHYLACAGAVTVMASATFLASCDKKEDPAPTPSPSHFHIKAEVYDANVKGFVVTTASVTITANDDVIYQRELDAEYNMIEIDMDHDTYEITVEKEGYVTMVQELSAEEMEQPLDARLFLPLSNGLMVWLPFNNNANDASGNNLDGTLSANPPVLTSDRNGEANKAYQFNGASYITIPSTTLKLNVYSYSVWVNATELPAAGIAMNVFSIGPADAKHQNLSLVNKYATAQLTGWGGGGWHNGVEQNASVTTNNLPLANEWYHLVLLRSASHVTLYINNHLIGIAPTDGYLPYYGTTNVANIGIRCNFTQALTGKVDEFRIYNRILTAEEIGNLYHKYD